MSKSSSKGKRPLIIVSCIIVAATVIVWICWPIFPGGESSEKTWTLDRQLPDRNPQTTGAANAAPNPATLSPAERITNDTRRAVEDAAAWRQKLKSGNQTTLPIEAYPPGVPPHGAAR
jgi:hypothetical protein